MDAILYDHTWQRPSAIIWWGESPRAVRAARSGLGIRLRFAADAGRSCARGNRADCVRHRWCLGYNMGRYSRQAHLISCRRYWLNQRLSEHQSLFRGVVIDFGGRRQRNPHFFMAPESQARCWVYLNIDPKSHPDVIGSVLAAPIRDASVDVVVCTEVLEHLEDPETCVHEAARILKRGGVFIGSVPFIYPVHPDPNDFSRFTEQRVRRLCDTFSRIDVLPMGGYLGTIGMLIQLGVPELGWPRLVRAIGTRIGRCLCMLDERGVGQSPDPKRYTTGYFWVAWRS